MFALDIDLNVLLGVCAALGVLCLILLFVSGLLNISILYWILMFYTVYVAYVGARVLLRVEDSKITVYSLAVSFTIICCPIVISFLFDKLSVILN